MIVKFKKLVPEAVAPTQGTAGAAGFDLVATSKEYDDFLEVSKFGTGIAVEIPQGFVGLIFPRSSVCKTMHRMANAVGVIDSDYRGEISAVFDGTGAAMDDYDIGDRIGQLVIVPIPAVEFEEAETLSETARGAGGYGSTGK